MEEFFLADGFLNGFLIGLTAGIVCMAAVFLGHTMPQFVRERISIRVELLEEQQRINAIRYVLDYSTDNPYTRLEAIRMILEGKVKLSEILGDEDF